MTAKLVRSQKIVSRKQDGSCDSVAVGLDLGARISLLIVVEVAYPALIQGDVRRLVEQCEDAAPICILDIHDDGGQGLERNGKPTRLFDFQISSLKRQNAYALEKSAPLAKGLVVTTPLVLHLGSNTEGISDVTGSDFWIIA